MPYRAIAVIILALPGCTGAPDGPTDDELAHLVARARPDWANYGEDMKAALGATPVARWSGRPRSARLSGARLEGGRVEGERVYIEFEVSGPWRDYAFGMPILMRDPLGRVHRPVAYSGATYEFELEGFAPGAVIAWVEVRFPPNEEHRLAFDTDGSWRSHDAR